MSGQGTCQERVQQQIRDFNHSQQVTIRSIRSHLFHLLGVHFVWSLCYANIILLLMVWIKILNPSPHRRDLKTNWLHLDARLQSGTIQMDHYMKAEQQSGHQLNSTKLITGLGPSFLIQNNTGSVF